MAVFVLYPVILWVADYVWTFRTTNGMVPALALAALESVGDLLTNVVNHPAQMFVYLAFFSLVWKLTFRR